MLCRTIRIRYFAPNGAGLKIVSSAFYKHLAPNGARVTSTVNGESLQEANLRTRMIVGD